MCLYAYAKICKNMWHCILHVLLQVSLHVMLSRLAWKKVRFQIDSDESAGDSYDHSTSSHCRLLVIQHLQYAVLLDLEVDATCASMNLDVSEHISNCAGMMVQWELLGATSAMLCVLGVFSLRLFYRGHALEDWLFQAEVQLQFLGFSQHQELRLAVGRWRDEKMNVWRQWLLNLIPGNCRADAKTFFQWCSAGLMPRKQSRNAARWRFRRTEQRQRLFIVQVICAFGYARIYVYLHPVQRTNMLGPPYFCGAIPTVSYLRSTN